MLNEIKLKIKSIYGKILAKAIGKYAIAVVAKNDYGLFATDIKDFDVGRSLLKSGKWEKDVINRIKQFLHSESHVLIVGAHIGSLVIPLSSNCKELIAIEANPNTYELLKINMLLNNISNCKSFCVAANNKNEKLKFLQNPSNSGGSKRLPKNKKYIYYYDNPNLIHVDGVVLDNFLQKDRFDFIVMDIEGSEYYALLGMQRILASSKVLQIEFLPHHIKNVSGVSIDEFINLIEPHFDNLTIPSLGVKVKKAQFKPVLSDMFHRNIEDDGIIFEKSVSI